MMKSEGRNISILIGHYSAMKCDLLEDAFNRRSRFRVVGRASSSEKLVESGELLRPDVVLISAKLEDGSLHGFVALRQIREARPEVKSIMLLESIDPQLVVDSFRGGAKGVFCPSQNHFDTLCRCVSRVHAGQIWASSMELAYVMDAFANIAPLRIVNMEGHKLLSKREEDVVRLVADGYTNRDVARELDLSEHTVKNYLFHIFDKLGVSSRVELVLYAVSHARQGAGGGAGA